VAVRSAPREGPTSEASGRDPRTSKDESAIDFLKPDRRMMYMSV
jgi:hypothetical protein